MLRRTIAAAGGGLLLLGAIVIATVAPGSAAGTGPAAVQVRAASLTQDGQDLVWRVAADSPFTASSLASAKQSLCLVIAHSKQAPPAGEVCIAPVRSHLKLVFRRVAKSGALGAARAIDATVTRQNVNELSASFLPTSIGATYRSLRWQVVSTSAATGCSPTLAGCTQFFPAASALAKLHTPKLVGCVARGPSLVYGGSSKVHDIALTFDDGPWGTPPTRDFIKLLAREHVPASFFEIGDQISEYDPTGSVERSMLANGDMIGDHTWTHPDMASLGPEQQRSELELTVNAIRHATGFTPCLWRPPYGDISPQLISLARSLGLLTIMWNIDPRDWALPGVDEIIDDVTTNARNGGIVEGHFGGGPRYETLQALPTEIAHLRARGYKFVTVAQMLNLRMVYR